MRGGFLLLLCGVILFFFSFNLVVFVGALIAGLAGAVLIPLGVLLVYYDGTLEKKRALELGRKSQ